MDFSHEQILCVSLVLAGLIAYLLIPRLVTIHANPRLPPGSFGWPLIGETMEINRLGRAGKPEEFMKTRMERYGRDVFKTSLFGDRTAVLCGASGNKFLFSSEKKLVLTCWPAILKNLFGDSFFTAPYDEAVRTRKLITEFLRQEALQRFVGRFDRVCKKTMREDWAGMDKVKAFPLIKKYAFSIACELFASICDEGRQAALLKEFNILLGGVFQLPIYVPGTRYYRAVRSAGRIRRVLLEEIESKRNIRGRRNWDGDEEEEDLVRHLMEKRDEEGKLLTDKEIADNVILLMDAGHDTSTSTMMMLIKCLAQMPECYERVLQEQQSIAMSKGPGELLNKEDIQKMKYSWNVVSEVLRILPPIQGTFREAIKDFEYAGFTVPKGWKVFWTSNSTHKVAEYFPEPEKFDPCRFERDTIVPYTFTPFGGGPRMCPGREFARLEILVFLHNLVREFKWELEFPDEKIRVDPMPSPSKGLPIYLHAHS